MLTARLKGLTSTDRRVIVSTLIVAGGFGVAKLTGVLNDFIIARLFGAGRELDAYYAAFGLPDLLFTLIAGGALAAAFIPVFTGYLATSERERAWKLASGVINLAFVVTLSAAACVASGTRNARRCRAQPWSRSWLGRLKITAAWRPSHQFFAGRLLSVETVLFFKKILSTKS